MTSVPGSRTAAVLAALVVAVASCTSGASEVDRLVTEVEEELPDDWSTAVIDDERVGEFVVSAPPGTERWTVGDDVAPLETAAQGTPWAEFWLPRLRGVSSERTNVRAVVLDPTSVRDRIVSWQINVAPLDDALPADNPAALAVEWSNRFLAQGLDVRQTTVTAWRDRNIPTVAFQVPPEVFEGEPRYVRQWFVLQPGEDRLWSFVCDGPEDPAASRSVCRTALEGFRPAPASPDRTDEWNST